MGLNDEDEDLVALRLAALSTMKAKKASENSMKLKSSSVGGVSIRDGFGNKNNALFQPHFNSNLIAIVPISPSTQAEQPRTRRVAFRHQQPESKKLILPQYRYCKTEEAIPRKKEKPTVKTKFNRYDSSSSDSSEESEDEGSTASGGGTTAAVVARAPPSAEVDSAELPSDLDASDVDDGAVARDAEPSFFVEIERPVDREQEKETIPVVEAVRIAPRPPSPTPPPRETLPPARSRSRSPPQPFYPLRPYADRSRSRTRSRSRSRPRLGRSRSPRRYGPRRSVSPKRRAGSPPRYSPPRRRSPSPLLARRRSSPRRRYGSPFDRLPSPPRRRSSPWRRPSPGRRYSPSPPRRRKSPSPVKRNPSPPRRFSPQRRSPLGRRVSPPRRNPSPPRKLYPVGRQQSGRSHSPRRYPSPLSPRRYNPVGGMSPWSPPRNNAQRSMSPQFARKRSPVSPRPLARSSRLTPPPFARKSLSPRPPPPKRRDSGSPRFEPRRASPSPPRADHKRRRSSPGLLAGGRRKSVSPPRAERKGAASPRFAPKRRRSFSPRGPRPGSKKRSTSPGGRPGNSPPKSRRLDERDARAPIRGLREAATTAAGRGNSKSLSLSPPPERIKVKSPLRVRAHRHERANGKKRTKSKKSRDKPSTAPSAEKTENKEEKSSVLEARRKKFENVDPIRPANKKIRLKTTAITEEPQPVPAPVSVEDPGDCVEEGERPDTPEVPITSTPGEEDDDEDDALVLDSPADLWSDEGSDSDNEGRFKSAGNNKAPPPRNNNNNSALPPATPRTHKVVIPSFANLLQPATQPAELSRRSKGAEKRKLRDKKRRRQREGPRGRGGSATGSVLDRIGGLAWGADTTDRLPALMSKDIPKPDQISKSSDVDETSPDPTGRVSRLDSSDQHGDLRAALSRKRAARSNVLFPFKGGDKGKVPGSRLVQSAFLDAVGKKQRRSRKSLARPSFLQLATNLAGAVNDARRVTLYDKVKASVKQLSESVTLATDDSTLTTETHFSDDEMARKPPVRLRLGLPQHADDYPGGRKVKLKRNNKNAASDQV